VRVPRGESHRTVWRGIMGSVPGIGCLALGASFQLSAQVPVPLAEVSSTPVHAAVLRDITDDGPTIVVPPSTSDEALAHVRYVQDEVTGTVSITRSDFPSDSVRTVVAESARRLLVELGGRGRSGMHLTAYGELFALAQQDDSAQAQFSAQIAVPGVTVADKAYTYATAVRVFADYLRPARMAIAERYLAQLRALPGSTAAARGFEAEYAMAKAYYDLRRFDAAAQHAVAVVALLPRVPYMYRKPLYDQESGRYGILIDAVSRTPNGKAIIAAMNAQIRASLPASHDSAALDQQFAYEAGKAAEHVDLMIRAHALVGTIGRAVTSNYWINAADTSAHSVSVADGKIRLLEFGSTGCGPCVLMYSALQRMYETFPGQVEPIIVTSTNGVWGNRVVSLDYEAAEFKAWFLEDRKVRFPIALYKRATTATDYGDAMAEDNPNYSHYLFLGKPTVYLLDGTGVIRRVFVGYSRETEQHIADAIRYLLPSSAASGPAGLPTTSSVLSSAKYP
jgi:hypothetical protein